MAVDSCDLDEQGPPLMSGEGNGSRATSDQSPSNISLVVLSSLVKIHVYPMWLLYVRTS